MIISLINMIVILLYTIRYPHHYVLTIPLFTYPMFGLAFELAEFTTEENVEQI